MILEVQDLDELINSKLTTLQGDPDAAKGWMQFKGLLDHVRRLSENLFAEQSTGPARFTSQSIEVIHYLLTCYIRYAWAYFNQACELIDRVEDFKTTPRQKIYWRHRVLKRLLDDWDAISPLLLAAKDPRVKNIESLLLAAEPALQWVEKRWEQSVEQFEKMDYYASREKPDVRSALVTLPYYGRHFELLRFDFAPFVSVMGVPLYDLDTPWGWQVIWHEMAGHIVHKLKEDGQLAAIVNQVETKLAAIDPLPDNTWQEWLKARELPLEPVTPATQINCEELFDDELSQDMCRKFFENLRKEGTMVVDREGWVAELLEDAYSTLSLGPEMLSTLKYVLRQHYQTDDQLYDDRHPTVRLRLVMTAALLREMGFGPFEIDLEADMLDAAEALRGIAVVLRQQLTGGGFVTVPFDPNFEMTAGKLESMLTSENIKILDLFNRTTEVVPVLVSASRRALEANPGAAERIVESALSMVKQLEPRQFQELDPPEPPFFDELVNQLFEDVDEQNDPFAALMEMLMKGFIFIDKASPEDHVHPPGKKGWAASVILKFNSQDGTPHTIHHYLSEHY
jgi:hypothetical protein